MTSPKVVPAARPLAWPFKLALGCAVALALAASALGLLELGLRIAGYGHSPKFYRTEQAADGTAWLRENRWVTAPFFAPEVIRRPQAFRLPAKKQPGTYRIFVLGSSAAMGDPESSFSLARMLDVMLSEAHPEVRFEVVNAGITAINSHVLRGIAADCAELEPDLFIVYEGNNEVIGPYGPGTVFAPFLGSHGAVRLSTAIKRTRTGQLVAALARRFRHDAAAPEKWGGMQMFLAHGIDYDDARLATTRELFRRNLAAIIESGREAGARVLLGTVVTNRRDCAPFLSRHRAGLAADSLARWESVYADGNRALGAGDLKAAGESYTAALALDDHFAELHYRIGQLRQREGRRAEAMLAWQTALDRDALRFRTDTELNSAIQSFAAMDAASVRVLDLATTADAESPGGAAGDNLLYEHVHLNFQGTYRLACEFFATIEKDLADVGRVKGAAVTPLPVDEVRRRLAYTTYEQAMIFQEMIDRFGRAPFAGQLGNEERLALYRKRLEVAKRLLAQPESKAKLEALYESAIAQRPDDWVLRRNAGMAYVALGLPAQAKDHLLRALASVPDDVDTLFALAMAARALGATPESEALFEQVRELEPRYPGLPEKRG
jgi:tetratricopeptide (TPR) repeat protein